MMFEKYPINHMDLPGIGPISGPVDFLVSNLAGNFRDVPAPAAPHLLVLEAKNRATYGLAAQLFAQALTLMEMDRHHFLS
jgi:hypothetical protein